MENKTAREKLLDIINDWMTPSKEDKYISELADIILEVVKPCVSGESLLKAISDVQNPYPKEVFVSEEFAWYRKIYESSKEDCKVAVKRLIEGV